MPHVDLLELPYFEGTALDDLVTLVDSMTPVQFNDGDIIVREGDVTMPSLFIATAGRVLVTKCGRDGQARTLAELQAPTLFGEIELFCQLPAVCTATAVGRVATFRLSRTTFDRLHAQRHPALDRMVFNVAKVACHRLAATDAMLAELIGLDDLAKLRRRAIDESMPDDRMARITGAFRRPGAKT